MKRLTRVEATRLFHIPTLDNFGRMAPEVLPETTTGSEKQEVEVTIGSE